ncbi:Rap1a/Tai family immunity protein [Paraburkholderia sp. MM5477-R1]|uniref:Rap1a/Tai family immunity protein n=1 Tax=Paraburkholderia sp. MM5477-R1 TaxID=2991062 RepID=UPI003D238446
MNRLASTLCALAVFLTDSVASIAEAGQMTVSDLQKFCTSPDDADRNACGFYILGVTEGFSAAGGSAGKIHLCLPDNVSQNAMEFIVKKAVEEDLMFFPDDRNLPAVSFVAAAMAKQYPCGK